MCFFMLRCIVMCWYQITMTPNEIRSQYALKGKKIISTARRLNIPPPNVHETILGKRSTRYIQEAIAEDIEHPVDQVFPVTKEAA